MEEIEVKFLDIDKEKIEARIKDLGGRNVFSSLYKRIVFDFPDLRLDKNNSWLRLRDEGHRITLAFKKRLGVKSQNGKKNDEGMEEIEVEVDDFEKTANILRRIGLLEKHYVENRRTRYILADVELDIDAVSYTHLTLPTN